MQGTRVAYGRSEEQHHGGTLAQRLSTGALARTFLGRSVSSMSSLSESTAALFLCFFVNCASGRLSSSEELATEMARHEGLRGGQLLCNADAGNS